MNLKNVLVICGLSSLVALSSGLILECTYSMKPQDDLVPLYTCDARVVRILDELYVVDISNRSVHMAGRSNIDVEALVYNETIGFVPRNVSAFFPNLQLFKADGIGSNSLTGADLVGFGRLTSLRFSNNNLTEIGNDLFIENPLLTRIHFDSNQIRHVAQNVFDQLPALHTLNIFDNFCTNEFVFSDRNVIPNMLFQLLLKCPPTFKMTEERIVNGNALGLVVQSQINNATATLHAKLEAVVEQLSLLQDRVELLKHNGTAPAHDNNYN